MREMSKEDLGKMSKEAWGNMPDNRPKHSVAANELETKNVAKAANAARDKAEVEEENDEMLERFTVPDLKRRMDINQNFPVVISALRPEEDGIERFAIAWNRKDYHYIRRSTSSSTEMYIDYPYYCVWRLIYALRKRSDLYTIEPPRARSDICVIAMTPAPRSEATILSTKAFMLTRHVEIPPVPAETSEEIHNEPGVMKRYAGSAKETRADTPHVAPPRVAPPSPAKPMMRTLNDLKAHFPVVWTHDRSRNLYLLDIFGKKLKEDAERRATRPLSPQELTAERRRVEDALREVLIASDAWDVYAPKGDNIRHFAVLQMKSAHKA